LNVTHKKPNKRYEGKTNDLLIADPMRAQV